MTTETETPRVRTRAPIAATATPAAPVAGRGPAPGQPVDDSWMHRGAVADQTRAQVTATQEQRRTQGYAPFRYWIPKGAQGDLIILDNDLGPCFYEHNLPDPSNNMKRTLFELCPKEYDDCPLCRSSGDSYYVMFLSVIDMRPYTKRDGTIVPWSRKLMAIKNQQQPVFVRLKERHGNLRGVHLLMTRDGQQSFANGAPEFVAAHTEEELVASFAHAAVTAQDGRVVKEANADLYPYQYGRIFTRPTSADLRTRYGGTAPAGSAAEQNAEWGNAAPAPVGITPAAAPAGIQPAATAIAPAVVGIQLAAAPAPLAGTVAVDLDDEIPF